MEMKMEIKITTEKNEKYLCIYSCKFDNIN